MCTVWRLYRNFLGVVQDYEGELCNYCLPPGESVPNGYVLLVCRALSFSVPSNDRDTYLLILATVTHRGTVCWRICIFATCSNTSCIRGWKKRFCMNVACILITRNWMDNGNWCHLFLSMASVLEYLSNIWACKNIAYVWRYCKNLSILFWIFILTNNFKFIRQTLICNYKFFRNNVRYLGFRFLDIFHTYL